MRFGQVKILTLGSERGAVRLDRCFLYVMMESEAAVWMLVCVREKQTFL